MEIPNNNRDRNVYKFTIQIWMLRVVPGCVKVASGSSARFNDQALFVYKIAPGLPKLIWKDHIFLAKFVCFKLTNIV